MAKPRTASVALTPLCLLTLTVGALLPGCAHRPLSADGLQKVQTPAFVSRVLTEAEVRVSGVDRAATQQVTEVLRARVGRFEVAERLRAFTTARLPPAPPWTNAVPPAQVAGLLQSFLVEEASRRPPDYAPLREAGADAVVELIVESYGLRGSSAKSGVVLEGYARLKTLSGRTLYRRNFRADALASGLAPLDARLVAQSPDLFRNQLNRLLEGVAAQVAQDLSAQ